MENSIKILSLTFLLCIPLSSVAGGGWPQPKKSMYLKIYEWWILSDSHFSSTGGIDPNATRGTYFTSVYAEYGLTDRLTQIINFPFFTRTTLHEQVSGTTGDVILEGDAINSIGDIDMAFKYAIVRDKPIVVAGTILFGLPTGNSDGGRDGSLQTGDGEFNQLLRIDASGSFKLGSKYPFATIYGGYNNRTGGYSDEIVGGVEVGVTLGKWTPILRSDMVFTTNNGDPNFNSDGSSLFSNNREFISLAPELNYNIRDNFGISVNAGFALYGRLIFANPTYSAGLFFKI